MWGGLKAGPEKRLWQLPLLASNLAKDSVQFPDRQEPVLLWAAEGMGGNTQLRQEGCRVVVCPIAHEPFSHVTAQLAHVLQGRVGSEASSQGRSGLEVVLQGEPCPLPWVRLCGWQGCDMAATWGHQWNKGTAQLPS